MHGNIKNVETFTTIKFILHFGFILPMLSSH